jgi:L-seryl-tRNA(Ser) seleniumtransferase
MLFQTEESLRLRAKKMQEEVGIELCEVIESTTVMGGGTLPNREFPTIALHVKGKASELERKFRQKDLIGRIENDMFLIDFRSILPEFEEQITTIIKEIL